MTKQQKTQQVNRLIDLIDKYAEASRVIGSWMYNDKTAAARQLVLEAVRDIPVPPATPEGPWTLGKIVGNWRDIDLPDHEGVMRIVWRMDDDIGRNHALEAQARAVVAALNAASATKNYTGVPFQAIKALLDQAMTQAVANGANSVTMPDEIVEVAHWLTFSDMWQQEADSQPTQDGEAHNFDVCQYFDNWLLQKGALLTPHSEESDGPMAPALNWIASVEGMLASNATADSVTAPAGSHATEITDYQVLAITTAYEQGVGKGRQAHSSGKEIFNPYSKAYRCDLAWQYGYEEGKEQAELIAKATPPATEYATYHLGACIADEVLHVSVIRKESGTVTVLLYEELQVEQLRGGDVFVDTAPRPAPAAIVHECGNLYAKVKLCGEAFGTTKVGDRLYNAPVPPSDDALMLYWLSHAGPVSMCMVVDRPHDGEYEVSTDYVTGYGKTLREAIRAAMTAQGDKLGRVR